MSEYPCTGPITATVRAAAGNVHVVAEDRTTVSVEVTPASAGEAARNAAAGTRVEMNGDQLLVEAPQARGFVIRRSPPLNISVRLPRDSRLELHTASADMVCDGCFGEAEIASASGDLRIDHVTGNLNRRTASGDTHFGHVDGDLRVSGASADLRGTSVAGDVVSRTASGDVVIEAVAGSVRVTTASGDTRIGSLAAGTARISTASGDVTIGVAEGTRVWLDLSAVSGDTRSELAVSDAAPEGSTASLNLHVRTVSGDILVRRAISRPVQDAA